MHCRRFVLGLPAALLSTARIGSAERQPHVVFLNPGEAVERGTGPYWRRGLRPGHGGLAQKFDHMYGVHRGNVSRFTDVALKRSESLDFRMYSKALNPGPGPYDFRLTRLVEPGNV